MLIEQLLLMALCGAAFFLIVIPAGQLIKNVATGIKFRLPAPKSDPVKEAKERLEELKKQAEAARLNKEADEIVESLFEETLKESDVTKKDQIK